MPRRATLSLLLLALLAPSATASRFQDVRRDRPAAMRILPREEVRLDWPAGAHTKDVVASLLIGNPGGQPLSWSAEVGADWLRLEPSEGTLEPGARRRVVVGLTPFRPLGLSPGEHEATLRLVNRASGEPCGERIVRLLVRGEAGLELGPFDPDRSGYELHNAGRGPIRWSVRPTRAGVVAEPRAGKLEPGAATFVRVSLGTGARFEGARPGLLFVNETDGAGTTLRVLVAEEGGKVRAAPLPEESRSARTVERFGITWTFSDPVPVGRFVNGDPWVLGPVALVAVDPASRRLGPDDGPTAVGRVVNGSMCNPSPGRGMTQGYDSAMYGKYGGRDAFDEELDVTLGLDPRAPLLLAPETSLVSTISHETRGARPQLRVASILTVLREPAPRDAFRPPYTGADKSIHYRATDLHRELLTSLPRVRSTPAIEEVERMFEKPWIDHVPLWYGRYIHPSESMPDYGREITDQVGTASLMLLVDVPLERKETLLVRFVQFGIDTFGLLQAGQTWPPSAGHLNGRKWPILFAGLMLGDERMKAIGRDYGPEVFSEDGQTFFIEEARPALGYTEEMIGLPEWSATHATRPELDDPRWFHTDPFPPGATRVELRTQNVKYRLCCTANTFWGELLAARILGAVELWNHPALFAYQDRFLETNRANRVSDYRMSWSRFPLAMWRRYRGDF